MFHKLLPFILVITMVQQSFTQGAQAVVIADSDSLIIGDHYTVQVIANVPKGFMVQFPPANAILSEYAEKDPNGNYLEWVASSEIEHRIGDDRDAFIQEITVTAWAEGILLFPSLPLIAQQGNRLDTFKSEPVHIKVSYPKMVTGDSTFVADIKPIIPEEVTFQDYLPYIGIGGGLIAFLLIGILIAKVIKNSRNKTVPPIPADVLALQQLEALEQSKADTNTFHSQVSYIVRSFIKSEYRINALELPTNDIYTALKKTNFPAFMQKDLAEVLETADLVKFAKASPLPAAQTFAANFVKRLVTNTNNENSLTSTSQKPIVRQ